MASAILTPDNLFEVSWEVCNKVGGIHTVIATKAKTLVDQYRDNYMLIGPDVAKGGNNPEFTEDPTLFRSWKEQAAAEGLRIRIGRWQIAGNPVAILVDFTPFYTQKNEIFTDLWIKFQLNSLSGGWDYMEPALFGYAAAKVIECFYHHHLNNTDKIVAQFHEWMTGTGILYLKEKIPQAATVFTTHATVLGRAIASSGVAFYSLFDTFEPGKAAHDFNVISKASLEQIAASTADCFTTVSDITGRECLKFLGRKPDVITQNGFDISILPNGHSFDKNREVAREKIFSVAEALLCQQLPADSLLVMKCGRYEYRNKGIDVFIDSLAALNKSDALNKTIIGLIFVPSHQTGPRKDLLERMRQPDFTAPKTGEVLTHYLQGEENDAIMKEIQKVKLTNSPTDKVKVIFVPTYLDGNDGIFNVHYYDLLIGFDLGIFPSYYEPWGYTPLESIAYHIPTVTTNVSGFGAAIAEQFTANRPGISVVSRTDFNDKDVVLAVSKFILDFTRKSEKEILFAKADAYKISLNFLWKTLISNYEKAYSMALNKSMERESLFLNKPQVEPAGQDELRIESKPVWRSVSVEADLPGKMAVLQKIIKNIWWSWNYEANELFEYIDAGLWADCGRNPILLTRRLSFSKIQELNADPVFLKLLQTAENKFDAYMAKPVAASPSVAYFSMEYGLCSFIKLYSGGLGVLAGDYLKEASDQGLNIWGVGLLYKNGYFKQKFSINGEQLAEADVQDFASLPIQLITNDHNNPLLVNFFLPGRTVLVQIWKLSVGRITLYLLDTDLAQNSAEDRSITSALYQGDGEMRLKQEILLGICGIRALKAVGVTPEVYHCNEGHASFINIERIHNLIKDENLTFDDALEVVRGSSLFTTHTSVPAAIDLFSEELLRKYLADKASFFNIDWNRLVGLGRVNPKDPEEKFSMAYLGANLSQEINGVSKIHRAVSRNLFSPLWKNFKPGELHIGSVTNGVHYATWAAKEWQELAASFCDTNDPHSFTDVANWEHIHEVPAKKIWEIRQALKHKLLLSVTATSENRTLVRKNNTAINENALVIGFARRFVTYKRSGLLFSSIERLQRLLTSKNQPVVFIFSGKAHPMDLESIKLINKLVATSLNQEFSNSIIFLEDYSMDVARGLVQGVDVWLNTPTRHTEASGTSGMKAALNGVINFSVLDGWWAEAYDGNNGWSLSEEAVYNDTALQNELDSETIFSVLENEIIPLFFDRDEEQVPVKWIEKIKASVSSISPIFGMQRVVREYKHKYYDKLSARVSGLTKDNFALAKNITAWKKKIRLYWDDIYEISIQMPEKEKFKGILGDEIKIKIMLNIGNLQVSDIGVEIIIAGSNLHDGSFVKEFLITGQHGKEVVYECAIRMERTGKFDYGFRIFPKNPNLPNRQDFDLIKWI